MVIMFDIDGCLADFISAYNAEAYRVAKPGAVKPLSDATRWHDYDDREVWASILPSLTFWMDMPPQPEFLEDGFLWWNIARLNRAHDVYFVTNRKGEFAKAQTEVWLVHRGIDNPTVIITRDKAATARVIGADFSLEDKAANAIAIKKESPDTQSFILDRPYNRWDHTMVGTKVKRVSTVKEFLDAVEAKGTQD